MNEEPGTDDERRPPEGAAAPPPTLPFPADAPELSPGPPESWLRRLARRIRGR